MTNRLDEWQQEAARRADGAVVPVLMTGGAMEFDIWFGSVSVDDEVPLHEPDRSQYISDEDHRDDVIRAHQRQWSDWRRRHVEDLYIAFCYPEMVPGVLSRPKWTFVKGPFTPNQVEKILQGYRVAAVGQVPVRFVAKTVRIALPGYSGPPTRLQRQDPGAPAEPTNNSSRSYLLWFEYCVLFLGVSFFLVGLLDITLKNIFLLLVLAAGAALVNWAFRPEGPYHPNSSIMWPTGSPRRKLITGLIVIGLSVAMVIALSLMHPT